jgi:hypothetical protein
MGIEAHRHRLPVPHAPRTPNIPHLPHIKGVIASAVGIAAIATAGANFVRSQESAQPRERTHTVPAEQMLHGYGEQYLDITQASDGSLTFEITANPDVLNAGQNHYVPVLDEPTRERTDDPYDSVKAIGIGEVMRGDVKLIPTDENGNPILNSDGSKTMLEPRSIDGLSIPVEAEKA